LDKQFGMSVIDPFGAGDKLRKLREYEDWTQEYVAAQMGIAKNTLSDYELSKVRISREKLELAAALFKVDVNLFFSPDPLTFNLHGNHGTQVARVGNDLVQHNVPIELFEKWINEDREERKIMLDFMRQQADVIRTMSERLK